MRGRPPRCDRVDRARSHPTARVLRHPRVRLRHCADARPGSPPHAASASHCVSTIGRGIHRNRPLVLHAPRPECARSLAPHRHLLARAGYLEDHLDRPRRMDPHRGARQRRGWRSHHRRPGERRRRPVVDRCRRRASRQWNRPCPAERRQAALPGPAGPSASPSPSPPAEASGVLVDLEVQPRAVGADLASTAVSIYGCPPGMAGVAQPAATRPVSARRRPWRGRRECHHRDTFYPERRL
jgi:hypothetical protein